MVEDGAASYDDVSAGLDDLACCPRLNASIYFQVDVDYEDDSLGVDADYEYRGPTAYLTAYF